MAHVIRPLMHCPRWHRHSCSLSTLHDLLRSNSLLAAADSATRRLSSSPRYLHFRSPALKRPNAAVPSDLRERSREESDSDAKKSRNEKKREAQRAVRWGMDLASFSTPQIKRILRVASLEPEVFEAIMLVKKLGRDVREGKRRQFNLIGRLLREAEPELMDGLIQATKDGDQRKFQVLSGPETLVEEDDEVIEETEDEDEDEGTHSYVDRANRWFDGLINKDVDITKEIYSVQDVVFDRQHIQRDTPVWAKPHIFCKLWRIPPRQHTSFDLLLHSMYQHCRVYTNLLKDSIISLLPYVIYSGSQTWLVN